MTFDASKHPPSLVKLAQHLVAEVLKPGDIAIDATAGNGHDTAFLLTRVTPDGFVYGFDIQQEAINQTTRRLQESCTGALFNLFKADHAAMLDFLPDGLRGSVTAIMFNLGYLPGSNKRIITRTTSTLTALDAATRLLAPAGLITVAAYPGHDGGNEEMYAVDAWRQALDPVHYRTAFYDNRPGNPAAPKLFTVQKID